MFKSSKKDLTQPVTLGDFQEFVKGFDKVISKTVQEQIRPVETRLNKMEKRMTGVEVRLETRIDAVETRLENKITDFKSEILASNDKLSKKLDKVLTEQSAKLARDDQQDENINQLKTRVSDVEQQVGLAPAVNS